MSLTIPKELGPGGNGANPEKLFATGYAACFLGAMKFVAAKVGPKLPLFQRDAQHYRRRAHPVALSIQMGSN